MTATEHERRPAPGRLPIWRDGERLRSLARSHAPFFGFAVAFGAALRLMWLGDSSFLGDQAQLLALGRSAADHHAIILTGIPSSLGTMNPPASTWFYGAFALLGGPLPGAAFTALANVLAIGLLYALAARYASRWAGFVAALLYATASGPVHYARFIWQQNLLAPIVLLFIWTVALGLIERRRGWLGWSALLWGIATELHPTAAPLLALIALALAFTWKTLTRREVFWAGVAVLAIALPTAVWEMASRGADIMGALKFTGGKPVYDTLAITYLTNLMAPAPDNWLGAASSYVRLGQSLDWLRPCVDALLLAAELWLAGVVAWPWLSRQMTHNGSARLNLDGRWRFAACLAAWQALPILLMLRHTRAIVPHYLLVVLPAAYLTLGLFSADGMEHLGRVLAQQTRTRSSARWLAPAILALLALTVSAFQTIGVVGELTTIHMGVFDALALPLHYGTPLSSEAQALAEAQTAARQAHATLAIASTRVEQEPLGYLNATHEGYAPATDYISAGCVAVPSAEANRPQVALVAPGSTAATLLPHLSGATPLHSIPVQGGAPYLLYRLQPGAAISDETALADTPTTETRPVAYATLSTDARSSLLIRWEGAPRLAQQGASSVRYWYGADPRLAPIANYTVSLQALDSQGSPVGAPRTSVCERFAWSEGLSLITVTPLPTDQTQSGGIVAWRASLNMAQSTAARPSLGPLRFETGGITSGPTRHISPQVVIATAS